MKTLSDNQAIIGLNDVRRPDLTRRLLFVDGQYATDECSKQSKQSVEADAQEDYSPSIEEGEDAGSYSHSKPLRRATMLQSISY